MGLFDSYFDPEQFQDSGGLLGRLLSLQQQQGQYQQALDPDQSYGARPPAQPARITMPAPRPAMPQAPDAGSRPSIAVGDYQMPQFTNADAPLAVQQQPVFGDRLSAGFQSWAHTPLGNPVAGIANAVEGFNSGQRTDLAGVASSQMTSQPQAQTPDMGDRFSSGFQSWSHTPVGNPFAALANGVSGFNSGRRSDPLAVAQRTLESAVDSYGNPRLDLHARYETLRQMIGDRNALLALVDPEAGQSLVTQALAGEAKPRTLGEADPGGRDQPALGNDANSTVVGQPLGPASTVAAGNPPSDAEHDARRRAMPPQSSIAGPRVRRRELLK